MTSYPEIVGVYLPLLEEAIAYIRAAAHRSDVRGDNQEFQAFNEIASFLVKIGQLLQAVDEDLE